LDLWNAINMMMMMKGMGVFIYGHAYSSLVANIEVGNSAAFTK
jgi:hypothetical protein